PREAGALRGARHAAARLAGHPADVTRLESGAGAQERTALRPAKGGAVGARARRRLPRREEPGRKMRQADRLPLARERHRALELVAQLAHVARPLEADETLERGRLDAGDALAVRLGGPGNEALGQEWNVLAARAERREP